VSVPFMTSNSVLADFTVSKNEIVGDISIRIMHAYVKSKCRVFLQTPPTNNYVQIMHSGFSCFICTAWFNPELLRGQFFYIKGG
jgi:hypothetical protein